MKFAKVEAGLNGLPTSCQGVGLLDAFRGKREIRLPLDELGGIAFGFAMAEKGEAINGCRSCGHKFGNFFEGILP